MPIVWVPFDGWSPSGSVFGEGWSTAHNLYAEFNSWRPFPDFETQAASASFGPMTGCFPHIWMSGAGGSSYSPASTTLFAGSKTRLFTVNTSTGAFTNVSRAANYGAAVEPAGWRFASIGNDIYCTNWIDPVQRRTNNAGLFADGFTGTFLPTPRFIAPIREHLVCANLSNAGRFQDEIAWSDADNPTLYDPPTGTSTSIAGSKRLISVPGQITGLLGGQFGIVWKRSATFYLEYTGTAQVFRPEVLSPDVGTAYGSSVVRSAYGTFFLGGDGFYQISGLSAPTKISSPGIDRYVLRSLPLIPPAVATASEEDRVIQGFAHPTLPLVGWLIIDAWGDVAASQFVLYNPLLQSWSTADVDPFPFLSCLTALPYAATLNEGLVGFDYEPTVSRLRTLSPTGRREATLSLRYRPANFDASEMGQSVLKGVLPVFSRDTPFTAPALTTGVVARAVREPYQTSTASEVSSVAERNPISGFYPLRLAGRMFSIDILGTIDEDWSNFEGVYLDIELLR